MGRIVIIIFFFCMVSSAFAQDSLFAPAVDYGVGNNPRSVLAADFDGNGTFQTAVNYVVGANPQSVYAGDFNGDGLNDLAVANYGSNNVSILINQVRSIWYVSTFGNDTTGDGSESDPFRTIQHGIDMSNNGDTILILPGIYHENIAIPGKDLILASEFLFTGDTGAIDNTILHGDSVGPVISISPRGDLPISLVISGLIIGHGATGITTDYGTFINLTIEFTKLLNNLGDAIYCLPGTASINIHRCLISQNGSALNSWGLSLSADSTIVSENSQGFYIESGYPGTVSGVIKHTKFINNTSGAVTINNSVWWPALDIDSCLFDGNGNAVWGSFSLSNSIVRNGGSGVGGVYNMSYGDSYSVENCLFEGLSGTVFEGADQTRISNCIVRNNPGTILNAHDYEETLILGISNCIFDSNGGGINAMGGYSGGFGMSGCLYSRNGGPVSAHVHGDGWPMPGSIVYSGNTFVGNADGAIIFDPRQTTINNNIVAFNLGAGLNSSGDTSLIDIGCNDLFANLGGDYIGLPDQTGFNGNISEDPIFCGPDTGNYYLRINSPCTDDNSHCGQIGEYAVGCGLPICTYLPGDANGNGVYNGIDVIYMVNYLKGLGPTPPDTCDCPPNGMLYAAADANGNCNFNGLDVSYAVNYLKDIGPGPAACQDCPPFILIRPGVTNKESERIE